MIPVRHGTAQHPHILPRRKNIRLVDNAVKTHMFRIHCLSLYSLFPQKILHRPFSGFVSVQLAGGFAAVESAWQRQ